MGDNFFDELRKKLDKKYPEPRKWFITEDDVLHDTMKEAREHAKKHGLRTRFRARTKEFLHFKRD